MADPKHARDSPRQDTIPTSWRYVAYVVAVVSPLVGVIIGRIEADAAAALVVAMAGTLGPVLALAYDKAAPRREDETSYGSEPIPDNDYGPINERRRDES